MRVRRPILVTAVSAVLLLLGMSAGAGGSAGNTGPRAATTTSDPKVTDYFTQDEISRSRRYTGPRYALGFASLAVGFVVAALLGLGGPTRALGAWAERISGGRWPLVALLLVGVVTVAGTLATLPFSIARGWWHERRWDLSTQSLGGFLSDIAKGTGFQVVVGAIAALGFYFLVRRLPAAWPFAAGGFAVALTIVLVVVYPLVYEPMFNRFTKVDAPTAARIRALATEAGVNVGDVLVADASRRTRKVNAYVSGLGATKRVVLYDTLLESSPTNEVDLVVAHELGHVVHRDVLRGTLVAAGGSIAAVALLWLLLRNPGLRSWIGASAPGDPRSVPFLAFVLSAATFLTLPAANAFSRHIEASADRFAVRLTGDVRTAVDTEVGLARRNIADLQPNAFVRTWFYTHPPVLERIAIALEEGEQAVRPQAIAEPHASGEPGKGGE